MEAPIRSPAGSGDRIAAAPAAPSPSHRSVRAGASAGDAEAGYVLIEMVATLVIVALLLRSVFPGVGAGTTPQRLLAVVSASAALLRDARTEAVQRDRPVAARFDAGSRHLAADAGSVFIPADVPVSFTAGGQCPFRNGAAELVFRPDGSNCGGVLRFGRGPRTLRARVNWADGRVDILQGP
jgi:general secretion pathway protein H